MRLAGSIAWILTALVPLTAGAVDVRLGLKTEAGYDNNVGRSTNAEGDFSFRFAPDISFAVQDAKFGARLRYVPTYEAFVTYTELNDLTHDVSNDFSFAFSDKTKISLVNRFRVDDVLNLDDDDLVDGVPAPVPSNDIARTRIYSFNTAFNLSHNFSPRWSSSTDAAFSLFETDRRNSSDSYSVSAFQSFNYAINAANRVGAGGGGVVQRYEGFETVPGSDTYVFRAWGSYVRNFGERTTLSIRVGPAVISNNQDSGRSLTATRFPHTLIPDATTVGQLRASQFLPSDLGDSQEFTDGTLVPAGSVVVPDPDTCAGLLEGSGCAFSRVLRLGEDDAGPDTDAIIAAILDEQQDVEIVGGSSGSDETKVTVFGDVTLSHVWTPNLVSSATYNRSQSAARGQGVGTIADSVSFRTTWRPSPLWDLAVQANYVKRTAPNNQSQTFFLVATDESNPAFPLVSRSGEATLVETERSVDTQRWAVSLRAARRITRRLTASARANWSDQNSDNSSRSPNNFGLFTVFVGIKYDFDPWRF